MHQGVWIPVKVLPDKKALDYFVDHWKQAGGQPFSGEIDCPETHDPARLMTTDVDRISHCITDIDMNTYDDQKQTVMVRCRFCGPHGAEAQEKYLKKDIRFTPRLVRGKDSQTGELVERIATFDCIQRPVDVPNKLKKALKK